MKKIFSAVIPVFFLLTSMISAQDIPEEIKNSLSPALREDLMKAVRNNDVQGAKNLLSRNGLTGAVREQLAKSGHLDQVQSIVSSGKLTELKKLVSQAPPAVQEMVANQLDSGRDGSSFLEAADDRDESSSNSRSQQAPHLTFIQLFLAISFVMIMLFLPYRRIKTGFKKAFGIKRRQSRRRKSDS